MTQDFLFHAGEATVLAREGQFTDILNTTPGEIVSIDAVSIGTLEAERTEQAGGNRLLGPGAACEEAALHESHIAWASFEEAV